MHKYAFDPTWIHARQRLRGLEHLLDPGTIRHLKALCAGEGWHCLEVGAGGGSIAEWLCQRVGRNGYVMATDLDTRFLEALTRSNLDVRRHDIVSEDLPEGRFDLVLSRLVVGHPPVWVSVRARTHRSPRRRARISAFLRHRGDPMEAALCRATPQRHYQRPPSDRGGDRGILCASRCPQLRVAGIHSDDGLGTPPQGWST